MKKVLWILGTIAVLTIWTVVAGILTFAGSFFRTIITGQAISNLDNIFGAIVFAGYAAQIILSKMLWKRFTCQCSACKKWGAMQKVLTKAVKSEAVSVLMTTERRAQDGYVVETQDQYVPGTKTTYQDTYRCKFCGHEEKRSRVSKSANL